MSAKTMTIRTTIDPDVKKEAEAILKTLGFSMSEAIRLFLDQIRQEKKFPFEARVPTAATRQALTDAQNKKTMVSFATPEELFRDLGIS